jgi:hypothetical protein
MRREVVVSFVDIGGIVDHLFKISFRNVLYRIQCKSQQLTEKWATSIQLNFVSICNMMLLRIFNNKQMTKTV